MRIPVLLTTVLMLLFSLVAGNKNSTASAGGFVARAPLALRSVTGQGATRFSSRYTSLTKCGSGMTKKEEKEAEERGTDIPSRCKGLGGYDIHIGYSACSALISAERGDERISLAMQAGDVKQKTVEWRMANGRPFAVIMRFYEYAGDDLCATGGKITSESLIVKGLKGYEHIDETVKVKGTRNPNLKARQIADRGYARTKS